MEKEQVRVGLLERNRRLPGRDEVLTRFSDGITARIEGRESAPVSESDVVFMQVPVFQSGSVEPVEPAAVPVPEVSPEPTEAAEQEASSASEPEFVDAPGQDLPQDATASFEAPEAMEEDMTSELSQEYTSTELEPGTSGKKRGRRKKKGAQS